MFDMSDVRQDMTNHVRVVGRSVKDTVLRTMPRKMNQSERIRLLENPSNVQPVINEVHDNTDTNVRSDEISEANQKIVE